MERLTYLADLLSRDDHHPSDRASVQFLKKYIFLCMLGELRINGQSPSDAYTFSQYLLDDRRTLIDWSRLSEKYKKKLKKWLFESEQQGLHSFLNAPYKISEINGKPEEVKRGFWGRLQNTFFLRRRYNCFKFRTNFNVDSFELKKIDICSSRQGALIDLVPRLQLLNQSPEEASEEYDDDGGQNVKRVILTNKIVENILTIPLSSIDFAKCVSEPHPHAINTIAPDIRASRMKAYRSDNQYIYRPSFIIRFLRFLKSWIWVLLRPSQSEKRQIDFKLFCESNDVSVSVDENSGLVYVTEKRPPIKVFVFSGGGAKIFGHLGAVDTISNDDYKIKASIFAGSSSGAIMAMLLYLGYPSSEIKKEFRSITDRILTKYNVGRQGLSTAQPLKDAIGYLVINRVRVIVTEYPELFTDERGTSEGIAWRKAYLDCNQITFRAIHKLKRLCPSERIGEALLVTGTDITDQKNTLFSLETTPDLEISEAVKISGSMPILYHPTVIDGHVYTDGGVSNNLPLYFFSDRNETFIEHELAGDMSVLAFQFDNGIETHVLHSSRPVYRENFILNFIYQIATRMNDPASLWVRERRALRNYACQSIIIDTKGISASKFDLTDKEKRNLDGSGEEGATNYLLPRYGKIEYNAKDEKNLYNGPEGMCRSFENLEELLCYCAYREKWEVFRDLMKAIVDSKVLKQTYKNHLFSVKEKLLREKASLTNSCVSGYVRKPQAAHFNRLFKKHSLTVASTPYDRLVFCRLFPLLSLNWSQYITTKNSALIKESLDQFEEFREELDLNQINNSVDTLERLCAYIETINDHTHLVLYLLKQILSTCNETSMVEIEADLRALIEILVSGNWLTVIEPDLLMGTWTLDRCDCIRIIELFKLNDLTSVSSMLFSNQSLSIRDESVNQPHTDLDIETHYSQA